jgi:hypothetical protein
MVVVGALQSRRVGLGVVALESVTDRRDEHRLVRRERVVLGQIDLGGVAIPLAQPRLLLDGIGAERAAQLVAQLLLALLRGARR